MLIPNDRGELQLAILDEVPVPEIRNLANDVKFYLYTRTNNNAYTLLVENAAQLKASSFNPSNPTKILIHGFGGSITSGVITDNRAAYLNTGSYNVIGVDWGNLCKSPLYASAVSNSRPVGQYVAKLVDLLIAEGGARLQDIHIIGHSLGAHVAGFAGAAVSSGKIGRITGLDAASPLFDNTGADSRLDPTDANLVDSIHTNIGILGMAAPIGDLSFYPNGGDRQPGCGIDLVGSCSHGKAVDYFVNSIRNRNAYPAVECSSQSDATKGTCTASGRAVMGEHIEYTLEGKGYETSIMFSVYAEKRNLIESTKEFNWKNRRIGVILCVADMFVYDENNGSGFITENSG
ncbi:hypothetical protein L9F63_016173, partial [Diploptera punctata]